MGNLHNENQNERTSHLHYFPCLYLYPLHPLFAPSGIHIRKDQRTDISQGHTIPMSAYFTSLLTKSPPVLGAASAHSRVHTRQQRLNFLKSSMRTTFWGEWNEPLEYQSILLFNNSKLLNNDAFPRVLPWHFLGKEGGKRDCFEMIWSRLSAIQVRTLQVAFYFIFFKNPLLAFSHIITLAIMIPLQIRLYLMWPIVLAWKAEWHFLKARRGLWLGTEQRLGK